MEKPKRNTASRFVLNAGEEECFVQREALMQDECQAFWAGSVINTCKGPNDDKMSLVENLVETLKLLSFWSTEV